MVKLLFGIHCHQPVGNFDFVIEEVYKHSYLPFLGVLKQHPQVKVTLHYSGCLLEWLENRHPEFLGMIRELVSRGQVEILGGGFYEPILAVIPHEDRCAQIRMLSHFLAECCGQVPRGLWLAERVWEPTIVTALVRSGIEYVLVDDFHFICAGFAPEELYGYYLTEEEGEPLAIFPIDSRLRYLTPFQAVEKTMGYLMAVHRQDEDQCAVIVDDGEKYGSWPDTYDWVYRQGWLESFFSALEENRSWIETLTFTEVLGRIPPRGRVYLPSASYFEMSQWALPAKKALELGRLQQELEREGKLERYRPFLRGGIWKNFLVKYPESNLMHKKMLDLSRRAKQAPASPAREAAQRAVYRAQSNDAYWHGVFGGIYLPHLRQAVYRHLLEAEEWLDRLEQEGKAQKALTSCRLVDIDSDGRLEVMVNTPRCTFGIAAHRGGQVFEWGLKTLRVNLLNTLSRRFEHYHGHEAVSTPPPQAAEIATIHHREKTGDQELKQELYYDWYERRAFIDHFFSDHTTLAEFSACAYKERGDFVLGEYVINKWGYREEGVEIVLARQGKVGGQPVLLQKVIWCRENGLEVMYKLVNQAGSLLHTAFGVEINLAMPASGGKGGRYLVQGKLPEAASFLSQAAEERVEQVQLVDEVMGGRVELVWDQPAYFWRFPLQTVSQSESGWEKTYQASVLLPWWKLVLPPGEAWEVRFTLRAG